MAQVQRSILTPNIGPRSIHKNAKTQLQGPKTPQDGERASALQLFKNWSVLGPKMICFSFWKLTSSEAPKRAQLGPGSTVHHDAKHWPTIRLQECQDTAPRPQDAPGQSAGKRVAAFQKLVSLGPQNDLFFLLEADFIRGPKTDPTRPKFNGPS